MALVLCAEAKGFEQIDVTFDKQCPPGDALLRRPTGAAYLPSCLLALPGYWPDGGPYSDGPLVSRTMVALARAFA